MELGLWILVGVLVLLLAWGIWTFNRLVALRTRVDNGWSQIDVQLRRRYDLIPNLVETVKGYATHEREVFERVTVARAQAIGATGVPDQAAAENAISGGLRQLLAVAEAYPDLKANQNFLALQEELSATEGKVAYARQFYNDSVLEYNNQLQQFPTMYFARMLKFERREYFEADEAARSVPTVEF